MTRPLVRLPRGLQHGGDFDRVVAVVVDDGDAVHLGHLGEAAVDAGEPGQRLADLDPFMPRWRATAMADKALETL